MKTLVIVSHPYPEQSRIIKSLQLAAEACPDVTVRNLESLYGTTGTIDVQAEQEASQDAHRIVFLFPLHWFNITPQLKAYMNDVWAYGWAHGPDGNALEGKELFAVTSAGAPEEAFSSIGRIGLTMDEILVPLKASAEYVRMKYAAPLAFFNVYGADDALVQTFQQRFTARLGSN